VTALIGSAVLGFLLPFFFWVFLVILGSYVLASLTASLQIALQKRDIGYFVMMPFIFGILHFGYGLGSLLGVFKIFGTAGFWKKFLGWKRS
jgi:hypothetical protein